MTLPDYAPFGVDLLGGELRVNVRDSRTLAWSPPNMSRVQVAEAIRGKLKWLEGELARLNVIALMLEQMGEDVYDKGGGS